MEKDCLHCQHYLVISIDEGDEEGNMFEQYGCTNDESFMYKSPTYRHDFCDKFESYDSQFE